jgi:transcriptional regulator with XRE-family HTH domain
MKNFNLATSVEIVGQLGNRLRGRRLLQGLTQQELAAMAGVSLGLLRKLELGSGTASLDTLVRVVQALGLAAELQALFAPPPRSIAELERAQVQRQRAPRRRPV